jgi:sporulenol synthase
LNSNPEFGIRWIIDLLRRDQSPDGSWNYPFETGVSTDAYMIILLRTLEINDEELIQGLASRIMSKQEKNGAWKVFHDEKEGNIATTLESYYGLLYSGYFKKDDQRIKAAKKFILAHGGIEKVNIFTKIMLAISGQYKWPSFFPIPIEVILLPLSFPVNFYQFSVYGRVNLAPILILADKKFGIKTKRSPNLSDLFLKRAEEDDWGDQLEWRSVTAKIEEEIRSLIGVPSELHSLALERAKKYMLERLESDGTFYSYFSSTFLMIYALLSLGYSKNDPILLKAVEGIKSMIAEINGLPHIQYTTANVWNTSLISSALQFAGVSPGDPAVVNANRYLLERQHHTFGDWVIHNTKSLPGGWGFSNINTMNPDIDDTSASLRSIARGIPINPPFHDAWDRGIHWLLSMQNDDGGWASFEKNIKNKWLGLLPIEKGETMFADPSSADLTGRTLEFLGNYTNLSTTHDAVKKGVNWLLKNQEKDGSWYSRWGVCYLNGTWAAVTGLISAGVPREHKSIQCAAAWIKSIQNKDGGWGESCRSDSQKSYVPLGTSTATDTSWALDSLIVIEEKPTKEIEGGISFLLESIEKNDWTMEYPKGQMMAGSFYVHYHSYRYIFPLMTLAHYQRKFE